MVLELDLRWIQLMLSASVKVLLMVAACLVMGAKVRHHGLSSPFMATQEVNRCLTLLRATSSAKSGPDRSSRRYCAGMSDRER